MGHGGVGPNGHRIFSKSMVRALWTDALAQYARRDGRLPGWNDSHEPGWGTYIPPHAKGRFWDYTGLSLLHTHLVFAKPPNRTQPPRQGLPMWMGGGGGAYWFVDSKRSLASISFTQAFGGRDGDENKVGPKANDASLFAAAAVDGGPSTKKFRRKN